MADCEIIIENEQDKIEFVNEYRELAEKVICKTLEEQDFVHPCFVSVTVTDNAGIHEINLEHRGIDRETDVLSFPVLEFENGKIIENPGDVYEKKLILGDIVVSAEKALEQSREYGHSFERELGFLICHSTLHLLGYDHEEDADREIMRAHEERIMLMLNLTR